MNKANYSNVIIKFGTIAQCCERYKIGRTMMMKLARECDAVKKIGRSVRIDVSKIDAFLDQM